MPPLSLRHFEQRAAVPAVVRSASAIATAHRTTTVIQHRPSVNPSGFTAERRRITAARYRK